MALEYTDISSNYTRKRPKMLTIEDIAARKPKRKHSKRHAVKAEIARFEKRKKKDLEKYLAKKKAILEKFHALAQAYWKNEIDNYPEKPKLPPKPKYALPAKTRINYK